MIQRGLNCLIFTVALGLALTCDSRAADTNLAPDFKEIYDLIHGHLAGVTDSQLDNAAVQGLLTGLDGKVALDGSSSMTATNPPLTSRAGELEAGIGYVRVGRVGEGLAKELAATLRGLNATNELKGLVVDLRYARGSDYAVAGATADLFIAKEHPLLDWGAGSVKAQAKTNALTFPLVVLVNKDTTGAPEALAAVLREAGCGLILGGTTAGRAMVMQDYPLKNGQHLSIATKMVKLGNGTELSSDGVKPDIEVTVDAKAQQAWFEDAYATLPHVGLSGAVAQTGESTNRRPRLSEAQLVRERREGANPDADLDPAPARPTEPEKPTIHDPVLGRAVDLLKALVVVRETRN